MTTDYQKLRLDGIYQQDKQGHLMLRVKIPAGVFSSSQAEAIAAIAIRYANGTVHLTCRGSVEFHWLKHQDLEHILRQLAGVGLSSRGACGGAVRGIACSTTFQRDFPQVQGTARKLNRHFMGNPYFEGLPKKFKVGIDAGYSGARHLIQDVGLVCTGLENDRPRFDVWCGGGLGRQPQAAFLLEKNLAEAQLIPLIEAIVQVYRENTPPPQRLKHLLNRIGEDAFRRLLDRERKNRPTHAEQQTIDRTTIPLAAELLEIPVYAGELEAAGLLEIAAIAKEHAAGVLAVTADQNLALPLASAGNLSTLRERLKSAGFYRDSVADVVFRICPGNHECRIGLVATRDVAREAIEVMGSTAKHATWAISGCPNICSQPQLADYGIMTSKLVSGEDGVRTAHFTLTRRASPEELGQIIAQDISITEVRNFIKGLN